MTRKLTKPVEVLDDEGCKHCYDELLTTGVGGFLKNRCGFCGSRIR